MPSSAREVIEFAAQRNQTTCDHGPVSHLHSDLASSDAPDDPVDLHRRGQPSDRVSVLLLAHRHDGPVDDRGQPVARGLPLTLGETTPTLLPELLRTYSQQAGHLARHPLNALDNNPFIMSEWLIVSQVLHAAARTLETRFEALFLGL
jgi:hypothetical protein